MAGTPRLLVTNRIQAAATVLIPSTAAAGNPASNMGDQLRSKTWRSASGWDINAGINSRIDFNRGGARIAIISDGNYATGAALASAVQSAMTAADGGATWTVTYNGSTHKITIGCTASFSIQWATGNADQCHYELGFAVSDTGSATSQVGANAVYTSRHWITANLGSALSVQAGIVVNHNAGAGGTYTLLGNASDSWAAPTVNQVLSGDAAIRIAFISTQTLQWWRLLINDCGNALGYAEVGIWFAGPYTQPSFAYSIGMTKQWEELSSVAVTPSGAHWQDERPRRPVWSLAWSEMPEADRAALAAAFALVPKGKCFFLAFDAVSTPTNTEYGFLTDGVSEALTSGLHFDLPVPSFAGALG